MARTPLAKAWKLVSVETSTALCEPTSVCCEAKTKFPCKLIRVSSETKMALYEPTTASVRANSTSHEVRDDSLPLTSGEAAATSSSR